MSGNVMVAELPKGGKGGKDASGKRRNERWSQGNYTKAIIREFFEIEPVPGTSQTKQFAWIDPSGSVHEEIRPFGYRKSKNYGFELGAASGIPYPKGSKRPIVVVRKLSGNKFLYKLLMPNHSDYDSVNDYLQSEYSGPKHHRSRIVTTIDAMKTVWPDSPLWK